VLHLALSLALGTVWAALPAASVTEGVAIAVCFAPEEDCAAFAVDAIDAAEREIPVSAYSLTTGSGILEALVRAAQYGIDVRLIADKTTPCERKSGIDPLARAGGVCIDRSGRADRPRQELGDRRQGHADGFHELEQRRGTQLRGPQSGRLARGRRGVRGPLAAAPGRLGAVCRPGPMVVPAADRRRCPVSGPLVRLSSNQAKATSIVMVRRSMIEIASTRFAHIATNVQRLDNVRYAPLRQPRLTGPAPLGAARARCRGAAEGYARRISVSLAGISSFRVCLFGSTALPVPPETDPGGYHLVAQAPVLTLNPDRVRR
jgi:hypothetical protein